MSGWLDEQVFSQGIATLPLVSIDLLVKDASSGGYLLGWRRNRPAANHWFVPGGRIQKNERLDDAFFRISGTELGLVFSREKANWVGVFQHFYDDCVFGEDVSTHYVVLAYEIVMDKDKLNLPVVQHSDYTWRSADEILSSPDVHQYSKDYFYTACGKA
ncbi:NUDIX family protein [Spongiibacter sp. IMCC21906]|uniref:GDP-mannose mannosyl hydrolase n=1 Tax=Spongiibacter sp. IMCC21906 TaxID=1620392 RepID=UPI00062DE79E|nr:GDP-mannose mannosyl hydrolase [Spongiibacter sp. IMCC21906]AKH67843.1 NUDIX family protein [Spongiibacter sp. IMCC21906]